MRPWLLAIGIFLWLPLPSPAQGPGKTQVWLVLASNKAVPGATVLVGVRMRMPPGWHTYWRNPGDSGLATTIKWALPPGIEAGEIQWPVPEEHLTRNAEPGLPAKELITFVYHDEVVLLVPLQLSTNLPAGTVQIAASVSWLECKEVCLPGSARVAATLTLGSEAVPGPEAALIETWKTRLPKRDPTLQLSAVWEGGPTNGLISIVSRNLQGPGAATFFPYEHADYRISAGTVKVAQDGLTLKKEMDLIGKEFPREIRGLLVSSIGSVAQGFEVSVPLTRTAAEPGTAGGPSSAPEDKKPFLLILVFAFLGGLVLNVMPCVLPVIALKILGFVSQDRENPTRVRQLGLVYGAGVLISFLALAVVVIVIKQAGRAASWGMQFQNPQFLVLLTVLVVLVALNLFGVFEVNLGGRMMGTAGTLAAKEGFPGAFFNGVLATILATPCTAPFLSIALGFAFAQSAPLIALIFLTIGAGLAAPYVLLSWNPAWLKFLPKPGVWMEHFKIAMGFPMLATAVWLFTLVTPHFGGGAALWFGVFLVALSLTAWIVGQFVQRETKGKAVGWTIALLLAVAAYGYILEHKIQWRHPGRVRAGIAWMPWSAEAVLKARQEGRPVLVDFTASWCLSCLANKTFALEVPAVEKKLQELKVAPLLGDYSFYDPRIAEELKKHNRDGVPLVLVYPADLNKPPKVLPVILRPSIVLKALNEIHQQ